MELFNRMPLQLIARPGGVERSGHGRVHLHRARPQTGAENHWNFGLSAFWASRRGFEDLISPLEVGILQHFDVDNLNSLVKAVAIPVTSHPSRAPTSYLVGICSWQGNLALGEELWAILIDLPVFPAPPETGGTFARNCHLGWGRAERGAPSIERAEAGAVLAESSNVGLSQEELDTADKFLGLRMGMARVKPHRSGNQNSLT